MTKLNTLGGGSIGVMGSVAKGALENGGKVLGIVPEPLFKQGSKQISEVVIVPDMHARKKRMAEEVKKKKKKFMRVLVTNILHYVE